MRLDRSLGPRGRIVSPQRPDQLVDRHDPIGRDQEDGEERPTLVAADVDGFTVIAEHLERPENPEVHTPLYRDRPSSGQVQRPESRDRDPCRAPVSGLSAGPCKVCTRDRDRRSAHRRTS